MEYIPAKTIVTRNKSTGWFGAEYNMNIYRGCCHGCIYCDSRSDCYRIESFDRVRAKENALAVIRDDLRRKVRSGVVATGAMSDPYNPFEQQLLLTRHALELVSAFGFGAAIDTKSDLITRDSDILGEISSHSPVLIKLSVTAADDATSLRLEPGAPPSSRRFAALEQLSRKGLYCGVLLMPMLPWITDNSENMLEILHRARECGARFVYPSFGLSMRDGQREYFYNRLDSLYPGLRYRYQQRYGARYRCGAPQAVALWDQFRQECGRLGLLFDMVEITRSYRAGYNISQLNFFD